MMVRDSSMILTSFGFIEAPRIEIEKIIQKHKTVYELVSNQWLHIIHIDSESSRIWRRLRDGTYSEI